MPAYAVELKQLEHVVRVNVDAAYITVPVL